MKVKSIISSADAVIKNYLLKKKIPLSVIFSVTRRCNFSCKYCQVPKQRKPDLPTEKVFSLIDQMALAGTQRLGIQGGEPLLRKDIGEIVDYAKNKGLFVTLGSNGALLPKTVDKIKNVDALILSYDGPSAHDKYRQKGSYEELTNAIKLAIKKGATVWNTTVLTRYSIKDIDIILKQAEEWGFFTYFTPLMNTDTTGNTNKIFAPEKEFKKAVEKIIIRKKQEKPILNSIPYLKFIQNLSDYKKTVYFNEEIKPRCKIKCYAGKLFCHIDTNGDVYPCINLLYKTKGYNAFEHGFQKAFEKISQENCMCSTFSFVELNLLFSLNISSIFNTMNNLKKFRLRTFNLK